MIRRTSSRRFTVITAMLIASVVLNACSINSIFPAETTIPVQETQPAAPTATPTPTPVPTSTPTPTPAPEHIVVSFLGDLTLADALAWSGAAGSFDAVVDGDWTYCFQNCADYLATDDLTYANFEGTYGDETAEHMNKEFVFANVPESVQLLINGSIEAVNLANNHSYDYFDAGLATTQETLEEAGILWSNQHQTAIYEVRGIKIGMFGIDMIGNGDTAETAYPLIDELREAGCQIIIASCHWGVERYYEPTNDQIYVGRALIDYGVDIVVGAHPHRLEPIEIYNGRYILYSLSNFCFGGNTGLSDPDSCIVRCEFVMDETNSYVEEYNLTVVPYSQTSFASNDYCPMPYEWESPEYFRVMERLNWNQEDE